MRDCTSRRATLYILWLWNACNCIWVNPISNIDNLNRPLLNNWIAANGPVNNDDNNKTVILSVNQALTCSSFSHLNLVWEHDWDNEINAGITMNAMSR